MTSPATEHIDAIFAHTRALFSSFTDLTPEQFANVREEIQRLEAFGGLYDQLTTLIAHQAVTTDAARLVGGVQPQAYFVEELGLSPREAHRRIQRAELEHGPLDDDAEAAARRRRQERERNQPLPREKNDAIFTALSKLRAGDGRQRLHAAAYEQALARPIDDLRSWLDEEIQQAGGGRDPQSGYARRTFWKGRPDASGGFRFGGYAEAGGAAVLSAIFAAASRPTTDDDDRSSEQLAYDELMNQLAAPAQAGRGGLASVMVSMTAEQFAHLPDLPASTTFPTNTGVDLSAVDLLRLGVTELGFGALLDATTGTPIAGGRVHRTGTLEQRLLVLAEKLVCSHPDCTTPAIYCHLHHIIPWRLGGETVLDNLDLVCPAHHARNDDTRTHKNGKSYFDRDPATGRKGLRRPDGRLEFNETVRQHKSAGHIFRTQPTPPKPEEPPP